MAMQQKTVSNRSVEALTVGRDTVFSDRGLTGFGVGLHLSDCKLRGADRRGRSGSRVGRNEMPNANRHRQRAMLVIARIKAGEGPVALLFSARLNGGPNVPEPADRYLERRVAVWVKPTTQPRVRGMLANPILLRLPKMPLDGIEGNIISAMMNLNPSHTK